MRRMTRLTNAFSKKWENLQAAYYLWFAYYNFCSIHKTLRVTPAMKSGISDLIWGVRELWSADVLAHSGPTEDQGRSTRIFWVLLGFW